MADEPDPPRKFYRLKPTEFERVNLARPDQAAAPSDAETPTPPDELAASDAPATPEPAAPIDVRELARTASAGVPLLGGTNEAARRPTDVSTLLRDNLDAANAAGLNQVAPVAKRRSRRRRDYFLVLVPVNAFFAFWAFGPYANAVTFIYGLGGMAFFTAGFSWVMFFIVEDY